MQTRALRPEFREALWSLAFALWSVAWPAGMVLAGGSTPGFMSQSGDAGLREVVEAFVPLSYGAALFAWGVLAFAVMWALLRLWRCLDPDRQSVAAVRWALSSRSLNLTLFALALAAFLLIWAGQSDSAVAWLGRISPRLVRFLVSWWWLILMIAVAVFSPLALLCLLNPRTLARDRLERWWRPFWPGIAGLAVAVACWQAIPTLTTIAIDALPESIPMAWLVPLHALDYLLLVACDLIALAWWFSRGRLPDAKMLGAHFFRGNTLRAYLGFELLTVAFFLVLIFPVMLLYFFAIYIGPQYDEWQTSGVVDMPAAYGWLIGWMQDRDEKMPMLMVAVGGAELLLVVAQGRLLYRCAMVASVIREPAHADVDGTGR